MTALAMSEVVDELEVLFEVVRSSVGTVAEVSDATDVDVYVSCARK
jgi:hypothetical protein